MFNVWMKICMDLFCYMEVQSAVKFHFNHCTMTIKGTLMQETPECHQASF